MAFEYYISHSKRLIKYYSVRVQISAFTGICARRNVSNFTGERFLSSMLAERTLCTRAISYSSSKCISLRLTGGRERSHQLVVVFVFKIECLRNLNLLLCVRGSDSSRLIRGVSSHAKCDFNDVMPIEIMEKKFIFDWRSHEYGNLRFWTNFPLCVFWNSLEINEQLPSNHTTDVRRDSTVASLMLTLIYACLWFVNLCDVTHISLNIDSARHLILSEVYTRDWRGIEIHKFALSADVFFSVFIETHLTRRQSVQYSFNLAAIESIEEALSRSTQIARVILRRFKRNWVQVLALRTKTSSTNLFVNYFFYFLSLYLHTFKKRLNEEDSINVRFPAALIDSTELIVRDRLNAIKFVLRVIDFVASLTSTESFQTKARDIF